MAQLKSGSTVGGSGIVTKNDNQALHDTDALRLSGTTLYIYKGNGTSESVTLPSSAPTAAQVGSATASLGTGAVGTYALLKSTSTATQNPGSTRAGSGLDYAAASEENYANRVGRDYDHNAFTTTSPAGTWRCMGYLKADQVSTTYKTHTPVYTGGTTLWLRIS
jgi:hypothetical protein